MHKNIEEKNVRSITYDKNFEKIMSNILDVIYPEEIKHFDLYRIKNGLINE